MGGRRQHCSGSWAVIHRHQTLGLMPPEDFEDHDRKLETSDVFGRSEANRMRFRSGLLVLLIHFDGLVSFSTYQPPP